MSTHKLHRSHVDLSEKSSDEPYAGLEILSISPKHQKVIVKPVLNIRGQTFIVLGHVDFKIKCSKS